MAFPVQRDTLVDKRPTADDTASVLLRDAPPGEWTAQTKVTVSFGDSLPYGWPQAGPIAYAGDDDWTAQGYGTRDRPRYAFFGKELRYDGDQLHGHAALGPTADTMWLRLRHTVDPTTPNTSTAPPPAWTGCTGCATGYVPCRPGRSPGWV
ncbi:MAG: hypothetical protein ACRDUA_13410 [Micromonosporaceae bacterium]